MGDRVDLWGGLPNRPKPYFTAQKRKRWDDPSIDDPAPARGKWLKGLDEFDPRQRDKVRFSGRHPKPRLRLDESLPTGEPLDLPGLGHRRNWPSGAPGRKARTATITFRTARSGAIVSILVSLGLAAPQIVAAFKAPVNLAYWKDRFWQSSLKAVPVRNAFVDTNGVSHTVLFVSGLIGPAASSTFDRAITFGKLVPGDAVVLSSPGGDLDQAVIIGERIRSLSLYTLVGNYETGRFAPSYCASACVAVFASGLHRFQAVGSRIGVHQFSTEGQAVEDPVGYAQRESGRLMSYFSRMGVDPMIVQAGSSSRDVLWLDPVEVTRLGLADIDIQGL